MAKKTLKTHFNKLIDTLTESVEETAKDLIEEQGVKQFIKETLELYASEKWKILKARTDAKRKEHEENLRDLVAQTKGEADRLSIIAKSYKAKSILTSALEVAGNFLIKATPLILGFAA